jgi:hypothetical protein
MMRLLFLITALILFQLNSLFGQDYYRDISKVSSHFMSENLMFEVDVAIFNLSGKNVLNTKGTVKKNNEWYYSKYHSTETFDNGKQTLIVDHDDKEMTFFVTKMKDTESSFSMETQIEQLKKGIDTVIYLGENNGLRTYELKMKNGIIKSVKVSFSVDKFILKTINYYYNTSLPDFESDMSSVIINYTKFSTDSFKSNPIDFSKYLTKSKGKYIPTSAYSSYKLSIIQ